MPIPETPALDGLRVLVVDSDLDSCVWMTYALEGYRIEVHSAFTVDQGLTAFIQRRPDVVLSDIVLPGKDGYALLSGIRHLESRQKKSTPVIAVTSLTEDDAGIQRSKLRFTRWFVKPVDLDTLVKALLQLTAPVTLRHKLISL